MRITTTYCDICKREIKFCGWESEPKPLVIDTCCSSQNPMARVTNDSGFQRNIYKAEEVCQSCMKSLAGIIADHIDSLSKQM